MLERLKLDKSRLCSEEHPSNMLCIFVALLVSKPLRSRFWSEEQPSNIARKPVLFDVSKLERLMVRREEQFLNIEPISVALLVSKLERFRVVSEEQPSNMLHAWSRFGFVVVGNINEVSERQFRNIRCTWMALLRSNVERLRL